MFMKISSERMLGKLRCPFSAAVTCGSVVGAKVVIGVTADSNEMALTHMTFYDHSVTAIGDPVSMSSTQCNSGYFISNVLCSLKNITCT